MRTTFRNKITLWHLVLAVSIAYSLLYAAINWTGIVDDGYIFFRYAHNIASGRGYVFNSGQNVEGTTSLTWTLLLAVFAFLDAPLEWAAKGLGALFLVSIIVLTGFVARQKNTPLFGLVLVLALTINYNFVPSILMGLETGLYTLLLGLLVFILISALDQPRLATWHKPGLAIVGSLIFLTRPESVLILLSIVLLLAVLRPNRAKDFWAVFAVWGGSILLTTLWRMALFGDFIPNSVRAKSAVDLMLNNPSVLQARIVAGVEYVRGWLSWEWLLVALGGVGLIVIFRRKPTQGAIFGFVIFAIIAPVLANAGDWMPCYRLLTPLSLLFTFLALIGLQAIHSAIPAAWQAKASVIYALASILVCLSSYPYPSSGLFVSTDWSCEVHYRKSIEVLRSHLSEQMVIAPEAIGIIGYELPNIPILDPFGLTDPFIARYGVLPTATYAFGKHHYQYVMQQKPTLFFFHSNITNHIPMLNQWGYSQKYQTYRISSGANECDLHIGIRNSETSVLLPVLQLSLPMQRVNTDGLPKNAAASWPQGER